MKQLEDLSVAQLIDIIQHMDQAIVGSKRDIESAASRAYYEEGSDYHKGVKFSEGVLIEHFKSAATYLKQLLNA